MTKNENKQNNHIINTIKIKKILKYMNFYKQFMILAGTRVT